MTEYVNVMAKKADSLCSEQGFGNIYKVFIPFIDLGLCQNLLFSYIIPSLFVLVSATLFINTDANDFKKSSSLLIWF